jgi:predicted MFS family arabinose efflux permease
VLALTNGFQGAVAALLALAVTTEQVAIWTVLLGALLMGASLAFNRPAHQAFIRDLVSGPDVQNAVALSALLRNATNIGVPLLGGTAIAAWGGAPVLFMVAVAQVGACALVLSIRTTPGARVVPNGRSGVVHSLGEVFRFVRGERLLRALLLLAGAAGLLALPFSTLLPLFADGEYGRGAGGLGVMQSITGAGALVGSLAITLLAGRQHKGLMVIGGVATFGTAMVLFALVERWPLALALLAVLAMADSCYFLTVNALMLSHAPEQLRGRVMSLFTLADLGMQPLGSVALGATASQLGPRPAVAMAGTLTIVAALAIASRMPGIRKA